MSTGQNSSNQSGDDFSIITSGAFFTAVIAFFGIWAASIFLFNFIGLVLGWIPAAIVAVVLYITAPFLYLTIFVFLVLLMFLAACLFMLGLVMF